MIGRSATALALVVALGSPAGAAQRGARAHRVTLVSAGNEQAVRVGKAVLPRPFGAQLVDRLGVIGSYRGARATYHLIRGTAAGECPVRYVVVTEEGTSAPTVSAPFGTCAGGARGLLARDGFSVSMPATPSGGEPVRFRYEGGVMRQVTGAPKAEVATVVGSCATPTSADPATQAVAIGEFEAGYPLEYRKISSLKRTEITPGQLRDNVMALACMARWPGAEKIVPTYATPLFASKRYGPAAFAVVETIARDPGAAADLRAAVRAFGPEMLYRVERREPL